VSVVSAEPLVRRTALAVLGDYVSLAKPRIVLLLLITCACAMVVAADGVPDVGVGLVTLLGLALSAGGANAINMWYDRDIDAVMARTQDRPVAAGRLPPRAALWAGIGGAGLAVAILLTVNPLTAALALGGFVYYVFVYTMWLKRRTPLNIVIGGGAGAFPPLVGWAAVTGHVGLAAVLMFGIVFLWTPPHFWALALYRQEDYRRAGIPMMPISRGERTTKRQVVYYTVLLLVVSALLYTTGRVGAVYLAVAVLLGLGFIGYGVRLLREHPPEDLWAKRTFRYSLVYLAVLFGAMMLNLKA
jgi:protoheme IX farnesyltransferase